jgi:hypothetical protein
MRVIIIFTYEAWNGNGWFGSMADGIAYELVNFSIAAKWHLYIF